MHRYGGAEPGDRTMIDALHPVLESLEDSGEELWQRPGQALAKAAEAGKSAAQHYIVIIMIHDHRYHHDYHQNQIDDHHPPGKAGAAATKTMKAKAGRASYVAADKVEQ